MFVFSKPHFARRVFIVGEKGLQQIVPAISFSLSRYSGRGDTIAVMFKLKAL
jgi:hypothetical protein